MPLFNVSYRKVGGLRFLKLGRLTFMWCVSRRYRPIKGATLAYAENNAHNYHFATPLRWED